METNVYLKVHCTSEELYRSNKLKISVESLIILSIYKCTNPERVNLFFIPHKEVEDQITIKFDEKINFLNEDEVPWAVALCAYPVLWHSDTVITGLCAVARHICTFRSSPIYPHEHEEGLLGFRKSCLQAPNEVSVWTKFCEIEVIETVKKILKSNSIKQFPACLVRYENHLCKPVKVHNVYKVARNLKKMNINESNKTEESVTVGESNDKSRVPKNRKWKSNVKKETEISSSTKIEDLEIYHQFAEGPFLTLADLILLPSYTIVYKSLGLETMQSLLPLTQKWYINILNCEQFDSVKLLLNSILVNSLVIENATLPAIDNFSLYKCDPKRHNPKKRIFTKEDDIKKSLQQIKNGMELQIIDNELPFGSIIWNDLPDGANPRAGHLPDERTDRKTQQLENLVLAVLSIAKEGDLIVDFCCGSGHLGIIIAYLLPKCTVILLENKEQSLLRARSRVHEMGLKNVFFYQCNLDFFIGKFDIGIGLHACGIATDLVLDKCLKVQAKFVLCPCCYGSLHITDRLVYPRSDKFRSLPVEDYICIGHAADQTHEDHPLTARGSRCMAVIDSDRGHLAQECGYEVFLSRLKPLSCTPKNNLLVGVPS